MYHADTASSIKMLISRVEWTFRQALPADMGEEQARQVHAEERFADATTRSAPSWVLPRGDQLVASSCRATLAIDSVESRPAGFQRGGSKTQTPPRGGVCCTERSGPYRT